MEFISLESIKSSHPIHKRIVSWRGRCVICPQRCDHAGRWRVERAKRCPPGPGHSSPQGHPGSFPRGQDTSQGFRGSSPATPGGWSDMMSSSSGSLQATSSGAAPAWAPCDQVLKEGVEAVPSHPQSHQLSLNVRGHRKPELNGQRASGEPGCPDDSHFCTLSTTCCMFLPPSCGRCWPGPVSAATHCSRLFPETARIRAISSNCEATFLIQMPAP